MVGGQDCLGPGVEDKPAAYPTLGEERPARDLGAGLMGATWPPPLSRGGGSRMSPASCGRGQAAGAWGPWLSAPAGCPPPRAPSPSPPAFFPALWCAVLTVQSTAPAAPLVTWSARSSCQTVPATARAILPLPAGQPFPGSQGPASLPPPGQAQRTRAFAGASCIPKNAGASPGLPARAARACLRLHRIPNCAAVVLSHAPGWTLGPFCHVIGLL